MRYSIQGDTLPVVICELDAGEKIITEGGGMAWMSPNMKMETTGGGIGKMFGRALSGDTIFQNIYTAERTNGMISIASCFPVQLRLLKLHPAMKLFCRNLLFLHLKLELSFQCIFERSLAQDFSVVKVLLCRNFQVTALLLLNLTVT